jgi:TRAP-type C4-dicarboxylate transport system substrate-binding protein
MPVWFRSLAWVAAIGAIAFGAMGSASAQAIQERTVRWGHLNNTDHPVSKGVQKFAEIVAAKSGGKIASSSRRNCRGCWSPPRRPRRW